MQSFWDGTIVLRFSSSKDDIQGIKISFCYGGRFGHLSCFSSDISTFVEYIDESNKLPLATALHEASSRMTSLSPVKRLRSKVSAFQMEELLGVKLKLSDEGELLGSNFSFRSLLC